MASFFIMARLISDKLLKVSPENDYWKLNQIQLLKRKRELSEAEQRELENMEQNTDDKKVICAVNILLENKRKAKRELQEMDACDREVFLTYPIYRLLK